MSAVRWRPWFTMRSVAPAARRPMNGSRSRSMADISECVCGAGRRLAFCRG